MKILHRTQRISNKVRILSIVKLTQLLKLSIIIEVSIVLVIRAVSSTQSDYFKLQCVQIIDGIIVPDFDLTTIETIDSTNKIASHS